jgi:hypothetical protein
LSIINEFFMANQELSQRENIPAPEDEARTVDPLAQTQEMPAIKPELIPALRAGDTVETKFAGGSSVEARVIAEVDGIRVLQFPGGERLASTPAEDMTREQAQNSYKRLSNAYDSAVDAVVMASGLTAQEEENLRRQLADLDSQVLMEATLSDNPDKAMADSLQAIIKSEDGPEAMMTDANERSLSDVTAQLMDLRQQADTAEDQNDEKEYNRLMVQIYATETLQAGLRIDSHPEADQTEKQRIEVESRGAVKPQADEIYDEGIENVIARVKQLENDMRQADKDKDEVAWTIARDEYQRHLVMMPMLKQADELERIDAEIEQMKQDAVSKEKISRKTERTRVRSKRTYWRNILESTLAKNAELLLEKEKLQSGEAYWVDTGMIDADEFATRKDVITEKSKQLFERYKTALARVEELNADNEHLKNAGINFDFDTTTPINTAQTTLFRKLNDLQRENPGRVNRVVDRLLASDKTSDVTRDVLMAFKGEVPGDTTETPAIPDLAQEDKTVEMPAVDLDKQGNLVKAETREPIVFPNQNQVNAETSGTPPVAPVAPTPSSGGLWGKLKGIFGRK